MNDTVRVALAGLAGYGKLYVNALLDDGQRHRMQLVAGMDVRPENAHRRDEMVAQGVQLYADYQQMIDESAADLVVVCSPIHYHCEQTCAALAAGCAVLCEKPLAATVAEARAMAAAEAEAGRPVGIGYQWSFSPAVSKLKHDAMAGRFGRPRRLKTLVCWPRGEKYYNRSRWAGQIKTDDGRWVLDSPVNNATAHFLHNMFYVLGDHVEGAERPVEVQAELYRAKPIDSFDTGAIRCRTESGVELLYYSSHAVDLHYGPVFEYQFDKAVIRYGGTQAREQTIVAHWADGHTTDYGNPFDEPCAKLWQAGRCARRNEPMSCGIPASMSQTIAINAAHDSAGGIADFPAEAVEVVGEPDDRHYYVPRLREMLEQCYQADQLPSEQGRLDWAQPGRAIDTRQYDGVDAAEEAS